MLADIYLSGLRPRHIRLYRIFGFLSFARDDREAAYRCECTGGDNERDTRYIVVRQRILHDRAHPSFVRLPIIPR